MASGQARTITKTPHRDELLDTFAFQLHLALLCLLAVGAHGERADSSASFCTISKKQWSLEIILSVR